MAFEIGKSHISKFSPTYFVADIAANHDGSLDRAVELINLAAEAGASAAKFQNFQAEFIVSDYGFKQLGTQVGHQKSWKKSVFEIYRDASIPYSWTPTLKAECDKVGIDYFSAPYDFQSVDEIDPYVEVFKIGSGDINWLEIIRYVASKGKPMLIATGASTIKDVDRVVNELEQLNAVFSLMQCNTNYTGESENFRFQNLNVITTYQSRYPDIVVGLSDHTPGHACVLGAIALGARVIEKHFTDDQNKSGPDHIFSMTPKTWKEMVLRSRELEMALGDGNKIIESNEADTTIIQRRCLRASSSLPAGKVITREDISVLRPATAGSIGAEYLDSLIGKKLSKAIEVNEIFTWEFLV